MRMTTMKSIGLIAALSIAMAASPAWARHHHHRGHHHHPGQHMHHPKPVPAKKCTGWHCQCNSDNTHTVCPK